MAVGPRAAARGLDLRSVPRNPGWLVAALLAGYAWFATLDWNVPYPGALPFGPLWIAATAAVIGLWVATGRPLTPVAAIALGAVAAMTLTDVSYLATQGLRDLHLYLRAGQHYLEGAPVYLDALFTQRPADLADYPPAADEPDQAACGGTERRLVVDDEDSPGRVAGRGAVRLLLHGDPHPPSLGVRHTADQGRQPAHARGC